MKLILNQIAKNEVARKSGASYYRERFFQFSAERIVESGTFTA